MHLVERIHYTVIATTPGHKQYSIYFRCMSLIRASRGNFKPIMQRVDHSKEIQER